MRKDGGQSKDSEFFTESDLSNTDSGNKLLKISQYFNKSEGIFKLFKILKLII